MKRQPILLLINGPAGIGKSTIAQRYIDDTPLALVVNIDDLIGSMGQWLRYEDEGWRLAFSLVKVIVAEHLKNGHDVVVPYLLLDSEHAVVLEQTAQHEGARYVECALITSREDAIERMMERGTWGEPGSPPLTEADRLIVEDKYEQMMKTLTDRPQSAKIECVKGEIEATYQQVLVAVKDVRS